MNATFNAELLRSPDWLLAAFEPSGLRYHFAQVSRQTYHDSAFLDHRIQPLPSAKTSLDPGQVDEVLAPLPQAASAWIFHTGFCCSTLLATCLDHPGSTLVLREPLVLSRLAHAQRNAAAESDVALQAITPRVIGLCERSYSGETLLVKPSNFANRLLDDLFPGQPLPVRRKAVLMSSGLESLLVSILKKLNEAESSLPGFVRALLQDSDYAQVVGITDARQLDVLQQSVLFWHCQRYDLQQRRDRAGEANFMGLSMERFLAQPLPVLQEITGFLGLGLPQEVLRQTVDAGAFRRHSKQADKDYDPGLHHQEQLAIRSRYSGEISAAMDWATSLLKRLPVAPLDGNDPVGERS